MTRSAVGRGEARDSGTGSERPPLALAECEIDVRGSGIFSRTAEYPTTSDDRRKGALRTLQPG